MPARVNRVAYREYTRDPDLSDADFRAALGRDLFGAAATPEAVDDALALQRVFAAGADVVPAGPGRQPGPGRGAEGGRPTHRSGSGPSTGRPLDRVREIERRYRGKGEPFAELHRVAKWVTDQWAGDAGKLLAP